MPPTSVFKDKETYICKKLCERFKFDLEIYIIYTKVSTEDVDISILAAIALF